jgi:hypothetical protein
VTFQRIAEKSSANYWYCVVGKMEKLSLMPIRSGGSAKAGKRTDTFANIDISPISTIDTFYKYQMDMETANKGDQVSVSCHDKPNHIDTNMLKVTVWSMPADLLGCSLT